MRRHRLDQNQSPDPRGWPPPTTPGFAFNRRPPEILSVRLWGLVAIQKNTPLTNDGRFVIAARISAVEVRAEVRSLGRTSGFDLSAHGSCDLHRAGITLWSERFGSDKPVQGFQHRNAMIRLRDDGHACKRLAHCKIFAITGSKCERNGVGF